MKFLCSFLKKFESIVLQKTKEISNWRLDPSKSLALNKSYISLIEFLIKNGHSSTAPKDMVQITASQICKQILYEDRPKINKKCLVMTFDLVILNCLKK